MTQNTKHTPGPWEIAKGPISYAVWIYGHRNGRVEQIAQTSDTEALANARLIADAPAMAICLEMLSLGIARLERSEGGLLEFCFDGIRWVVGKDWTHVTNGIGWDRARAAIAKAIGEGQ